MRVRAPTPSASEVNTSKRASEQVSSHFLVIFPLLWGSLLSPTIFEQNGHENDDDDGGTVIAPVLRVPFGRLVMVL